MFLKSRRGNGSPIYWLRLWGRFIYYKKDRERRLDNKSDKKKEREV